MFRQSSLSTSIINARCNEYCPGYVSRIHQRRRWNCVTNSFLLNVSINVFDVFRVSCTNPLKKMLLKAESNWKNATLYDSVTIKCQNTTEYDINLYSDYICTPSCPKPLKSGNEIQHDWPELASGPNLGQTVTYSCPNGLKIVSKKNFSIALPNAPQNTLDLTCESTGKYNLSKLFYPTVFICILCILSQI